MAEKTPATTTSTSKKERKAKTYTEQDIEHLAADIVAVPKRRKTYSRRQVLERLRPTIFAGVREGRSIDDIYITVAPVLHVSRKTFDNILDADALQAAEAMAYSTIDTTAEPTTTHKTLPVPPSVPPTPASAPSAPAAGTRTACATPSASKRPATSTLQRS